MKKFKWLLLACALLICSAQTLPPTSGSPSLVASQIFESTGKWPAFALANAQLPTIADGTILGNASGGAAVASALSSLPSAVTVGSSNLALVNADLPGSSVRYAAGTTLTLVSTDNGNVVAQNNSSAVAATLPQIGTNSVLAGAFQMVLLNQGTGTVTITPTTSTINGNATLALLGGQGALILADNTTSPGNYVALSGLPTTLPASQLTGGTMSGTVALINGAVVGGTGLVPSSATCTNNRINLPAANTIGICTNGSQALQVDASGTIATLGSAVTVTPVSGCSSVTFNNGDSNAMKITLTTVTSVCTFTVNLPTLNPAPVGWACNGADLTNGTSMVMINTAGTTDATHATVKTGASPASGDVVYLQCRPIKT